MKREKQDDNGDKPATCFLRRCPRRVSTHVPEKAWVQENIFVNAQATQTHNTVPEAQDWKPNYKDLNGKLL